MIKTYQNIIAGLLVFIFAFAMALWVISLTQKAESSAPNGMRTLISSSTVKATVGTTTITLFDANSACTSRVVTTYAQPILFTFATSTDLDQTVEPTLVFGHIQAASTTISYDAGIYGCGVMQAISYPASAGVPSTTISITEFTGFR